MGWALASLLVLSAVACATQTSAAAIPAKPTSKTTHFVLCQSKKDVRTIRIEEKQDGDVSCRTYYSRNGMDHEVAHGRFMPSCTRVVKNIEMNLKKANWKCRDVSSVSTTNAQQ